MNTTIITLSFSLCVQISDNAIKNYAKHHKLNYEEAYRKLLRIALIDTFMKQLDKQQIV